MYKLCLILLLCLDCFKIQAQTADEEARVLFTQAQEAYEAKDYLRAENIVAKVMNKLGKPNPAIMYLFIKVDYDGIKSKQFNLSLQNINNEMAKIKWLFANIDKSNYPQEKYDEVLRIKLDLEDMMQPLLRKKKVYESLTRREAKFIKDTIDVYMQAFVNIWNECEKEAHGKEKRLSRVAYDTTTHTLIILPSNKGGSHANFKEVSMLQSFEIKGSKSLETGNIVPRCYFNLPTRDQNFLFSCSSLNLNDKRYYWNCEAGGIKLSNLEELENATGFMEYFDLEGYRDVKDEADRARDDYRKALKRGDNVKVLAQLLTNLGDACYYLNKYEEGDNAFNQSLKLDPENDTTLNTYSWNLAVRNANLEKAKEMSAKANKIRPNIFYNMGTYAKVLFQMKNYTEAKDWQERCLKAGGDKSSFDLEQYGDILIELGDKNKAVDYWKKAKEMGSASETLNTKIATLKYVPSAN